MVCKNCGKALGNEQATCPFCGSFVSSSQINAFVEMKKEKEKDLRPKLISERYGLDPIKYERQSNEISSKLIFLLIGLGILVIIFLVIILIIF